MCADAAIGYRVTRLEKDRGELVAEMKSLAESQRKLAESQVEMSADIRVLIKEQTRLTLVLHSIAEYQSDVKHMHSTQSRLFNRLERAERSQSELRDDFHMFRAEIDGQKSVLGWIADHWVLVSAAVSTLIAGGWFASKSSGG